MKSLVVPVLMATGRPTLWPIGMRLVIRTLVSERMPEICRAMSDGMTCVGSSVAWSMTLPLSSSTSKIAL